MRVFFLLPALMLASLSLAGRVVLRVGGSLGLKGKAIVLNEMRADGSKSSKMEMTLTDSNGKSILVTQEASYGASGVPVFKSMKTQVEGLPTQTIVAAFSSHNVTLTSMIGENASETSLPVPTDLTIAEKFEYWFCRDKIPVKGQNSFYRFDLTTLTFERTTSIYVGRKSITTGGRTRMAHLVQVGDSKIYLDDAGDPYRIVSPGVTMERA